MKKLLLLMLLIPVFAYASPCQEFEYAELKDMNQKTLEKEYCNVADQIKEKMVILQQVYIERCRQDMVSCSGIADKMKRVYKKRFNKDIPKCPKAETKEKKDNITGAGIKTPPLKFSGKNEEPLSSTSSVVLKSQP